ncbi:MAG TPA: NADP-dependent oxidoreductase [Candidatus Rothia avicola]|uniref:NADP-dependent oxidoreductase n=1 Tax=Candidatus Rothia avicola TaxID=2840478 RepID=A0A9D1ZTE0_9MICC|nr:NADP-dependent oxidoreductase [Candidatus Rothia avicola]
MTQAREIRLASRPSGWPTSDNFEFATVTLPELTDGQVRVKNEFISVDPYMRGRMNDAKSYVAPYGLGERITGGAVGRVVESHDESLPVGTLVSHQQGWADYAQGAAREFTALPELPAGAPSSLYLGMLGMTAMTAYAGLTRIAHLKEGDVVFVSGAAGAVGTAVGQIARLLGASRVVGSAGSAEKVELLTSKYGYDAALNYKDAPVRQALPELVPDGVDVYFDNVGGDHLEAALDVMNRGGRLALCGAISAYNTNETTPGPDNMTNMVKQGLTMQGFTLGEYLDVAPEFREKMGRWFADGKIAYDETVYEGLDSTIEAFIAMMQGANTGKMVVKL